MSVDATTQLKSKVRSTNVDCPFCEDGGTVNQDMEGFICADCLTVVPFASVVNEVGEERYEKSNLVKLYGGFEDAYLHEADVDLDEVDIGEYEFVESSYEELTLK